MHRHQRAASMLLRCATPGCRTVCTAVRMLIMQTLLTTIRGAGCAGSCACSGAGGGVGGIAAHLEEILHLVPDLAAQHHLRVLEALERCTAQDLRRTAG